MCGCDSDILWGLFWLAVDLVWRRR